MKIMLSKQIECRMVEKTVEWVSDMKDTNLIPSPICRILTLIAKTLPISVVVGDLTTFDYHQVF